MHASGIKRPPLGRERRRKRDVDIRRRPLSAETRIVVGENEFSPGISCDRSSPLDSSLLPKIKINAASEHKRGNVTLSSFDPVIPRVKGQRSSPRPVAIKCSSERVFISALGRRQIESRKLVVNNRPRLITLSCPDSRTTVACTFTRRDRFAQRCLACLAFNVALNRATREPSQF